MNLRKKLVLFGAFVLVVVASSLLTLYFKHQNDLETAKVKPATTAEVQAEAKFNTAQQQVNDAIIAKKYDDAVKVWADFLATNPADSQKYSATLGLASVYVLKGDNAQALTQYQAAEKLSGAAQFPEAIGAAQAADQLKQTTVALEYYQKALPLAPNDSLKQFISARIDTLKKS
jgi:tetratricopeptide (TPR) repeat protein